MGNIIPTPTARLLFENVKTLTWLNEKTAINFPSLVNFRRGYRVVKKVKMDGDKQVLDGKGNPIKIKVKIKYTPENRTKRDIAKAFTSIGAVADPNTIYEHRHDSPDPIEEENEEEITVDNKN